MRIQRQGVRVHAGPLVFVLSARTEPGPARLGTTVSSKVGNAVVRNRWKRLIREAFRQARGDLPANVDLVVIVKAGAAPTTFADVSRCFAQAKRDLGRRAATLTKSAVATPAGVPEKRRAPPERGS